MCGIFGVLGNTKDEMCEFRKKAISLAKRIRHRGPDWTGVESIGTNVLCHERLAIVGVDSGSQPLSSDGLILSVNGEIYNHSTLQTKLQQKHTFKTKSDCEVILYLVNTSFYILIECN